MLQDDYFYRADKKYDLYLGHLWLKKNWVAPVGDRRCCLLQFGPKVRPKFSFLQARIKNGEECLKKKILQNLEYILPLLR